MTRLNVSNEVKELRLLFEISRLFDSRRDVGRGLDEALTEAVEEPGHPGPGHQRAHHGPADEEIRPGFQNILRRQKEMAPYH